MDPSPELHTPDAEAVAHESHRSPESATLLPRTQPLAGPGEEPGTEASMPHERAVSAAALLGSIALAFVGFALAALLIHLCIRRPLYLHAEVRSGKLAILEQYRGRALTASFGSSHVHMGFDPRVFDRTLAGTPLASTSVNLAIGGGSQSEQRTMALEYVRGLQPPPAGAAARSCLVMLELGAGANFNYDHLIHPRAINIYDLDQARFITALASPGMPRTQLFGRRGFAYGATALHYANVGMLSNDLLPNLSTEAEYSLETANDRRGMLVLPPWTPAEQVADEARMGRIIASAPATPTRVPGDLLPGNRLLIAQLQAASAVRGVQFAYVLMPQLADLTSFEVYPDSMEVNGMTVPILALNRPDLYPEIYKLPNWRDESHLNEDGAALATAVLARQLLAFHAQHPVPACGV